MTTLPLFDDRPPEGPDPTTSFAYKVLVFALAALLVWLVLMSAGR